MFLQPYPQRRPSMPCRALLSVLKIVKLNENEPMNSMNTTTIARGIYRDEALILMSTPAGRLSLLRASIVLAVAWTMSITLLCVRISYC